MCLCRAAALLTATCRAFAHSRLHRVVTASGRVLAAATCRALLERSCRDRLRERRECAMRIGMAVKRMAAGRERVRMEEEERKRKGAEEQAQMEEKDRLLREEETRRREEEARRKAEEEEERRRSAEEKRQREEEKRKREEEDAEAQRRRELEARRIQEEASREAASRAERSAAALLMQARARRTLELLAYRRERAARALWRAVQRRCHVLEYITARDAERLRPLRDAARVLQV